MPYTLPSLICLEALVDEITCGANGPRQKAVAAEIMQEFRQLKAYAESLTKLLNEQESPSQPTNASEPYGY